MSLKIAVGLGNSGDAYDSTRHNVGAMKVASFARESGASFSYEKYCASYIAKISLAGETLCLAVMKGYMNESGANLRNLLKFLKADISECAVLYDDVSMEVGKVKISCGGSSGGHNGVDDIMKKCGNSFARIRIGVGAKAHKGMDLADHVLGKIPQDDVKALEGADAKVSQALELLAKKGLEAAQNVVNRRPIEPKVEISKEQKNEKDIEKQTQEPQE